MSGGKKLKRKIWEYVYTYSNEIRNYITYVWLHKNVKERNYSNFSGKQRPKVQAVWN